MDFKLKKSNLNFRVYTAASLPETGQENDICVISDVPMKNWFLSPDDPSGAPRNDGDVWIRYSVGGNIFNALKNNTMLIAAISAKQYVDGVWVDVDVKSYQNGAFVDRLRKLLYENGDEFTDFSGGWTVCKDTVATASKEGSYITIAGTTAGAQARRHASAYTNKAIDLTPFNKLRVTVETWNPGEKYGDPFEQLKIGYATNLSAFTSYSYSSIIGQTITSVIGKTTYEIDVSSVNSSVYIGASIKNCGARLYLFELT